MADRGFITKVARRAENPIKNLPGSSAARRCRCRSWIKHWKRYSGEEPGPCANRGCGNPATVGGHVTVTGKRGVRGVRIVPLCQTCNHWRNIGSMPYREGVVAVPVDHEAAKVEAALRASKI